ncbi:MAG: 3-oxoadipyl-CoA thiolase [Pseudomonadota bacterium]
MAYPRPAFVCDGVRTPIGRYNGVLSGVRADDLAAIPIRALLERNASLTAHSIDDVILGCANQAGEDNRNVARMAALLAGLPDTVSGTTVNRLCGSGLDAVLMGSRMIQSGDAELIIAGGVESMSRAPFVLAKAETAFSRQAEIHDTTIGWRFINPKLRAQYGTDAMPETAENVAQQFGVSREDQDAFAERSQARAAKARSAGIWAEEIIPVSAPRRGHTASEVVVDEHPRPETTIDGLSKLPTPFKAKGGTVTAGNSSGINDDSAALILASKTAMERFALTPRAKILGGAAAGCAPRIMGIGPAVSSKKLLARHKLPIEAMDVVELNEAFAAQALATVRQLGIPDDAEHVNPNGGAIALGHPLGMSGARLVLTAIRQLDRIDGRFGLCAMCVGVGQGISAIIERV